MRRDASKEIDGRLRTQEERDTQVPRVLIADDDEDLRLLLADALREDGYQVVEAEDGRQLLELIASRLASPRGRAPDAFDLVVCDIFMPGPDGLWALATLQTMNSETPFLVMTASRDPETLHQADRLGALRVLQKPIDLAVFREAVKEVVGAADLTCDPRTTVALHAPLG